MLSKEEVLEIIFYCDSHKINRGYTMFQSFGVAEISIENR